MTGRIAAAVGAVVLVGGLIVGGRLLRATGHSPEPPHRSQSRAAPSSAGARTLSPSWSITAVRGHALHGQPRYLVTSVQAHGMIMSAATGKVVARIRRPERYFLIDGVAA